MRQLINQLINQIKFDTNKKDIDRHTSELQDAVRAHEQNLLANVSTRYIRETSVKSKSASAKKRSAQYVKTKNRKSALHAYVHELLSARRFTRKAMIDLCLKRFDSIALSSITTCLTDVKNVKYFERYVDTLVIADSKSKIMHYENQTALSADQIQRETNQSMIDAA